MNNDNEFFEGFDFDEDDSEYLNIVDEESNEEIELLVINKLKYNDYVYFLVLETEFMDDDDEEPEATILKEVPDGTGDFYYEPVFDDEEFESVAELFKKNASGDYEIGI